MKGGKITYEIWVLTAEGYKRIVFSEPGIGRMVMNSIEVKDEWID